MQLRSHDWLGKGLDGGLAEPAVGAGQGSTSGGTRKVIVEQLDNLRGEVLLKALGQYPDRTARPVWTWRERDKLSAMWLLSGPGPDTRLSNMEFSEAAAALLCLPSPVCADKIGCRVGDRRVDLYDDQVQAATMEGDGWRTRHDNIKLFLTKLFHWAHLPYQCEVFNLFAHLIPQEGLSRIERGRKRQGLVPDFMLEITNGRGDKRKELAELKCISCCPTRYNMSPALVGNRIHVRAVQRRANGLTGHYMGKATGVDQNYGGVRPGEVGRVQRKLETFGEVRGLVFGAFGEVSEGVHELIQVVAQSRLRAVGLQKGRVSEKGELGVLVGRIRKQLSVAAVRTQADCLITRLGNVGEGTGAAGKRRGNVIRWERRWEKEMQAEMVCERQGRRILRRGQIMLD